MCIGITSETPTLVTISPAGGPQGARDAGLGLEVTERVPSGDLEPQPKETNTHPPQPVFFFGGPGTTESLFFRRGYGPDDDTASVVGRR